MYVHFDMSTIAIILYIGILLMAATVAGMTIVYFLKPGASRTSRALIAERKRKAQIEAQESGAVEIQPTVVVPAKPVETASLKASTVEVKPAVESKNTIEAKKESPKQEPVNQKEKAVKADLPPQPKAVEKPAPKPEAKKEENKTQTPTAAQKPIAPPATKTPANTPPIAAAKTAEPVKPAPVVKTETKTTAEVKKAAIDIKPSEKAEPEKPKTAAPVENKPDTGKKGPEPNSLGDLSKMFSKDVAEETEATKLAKNLKDVDITGLLKDGQDLISFLKNGRSK